MFSNKRTLGLFLALTSAVGFAFSNTFASLSYQSGVNPLTITATRFILPGIALVILLRMSGTGFILPKRPGLVAASLGFISIIYTMALLSAIEVLPLAIAVLIFYLFPIFTALMLALLGWRKLTPTMAVSGGIAFLGLGIALGAEFENLDGWGLIYGLISAIGLATVSVISNRLMTGYDPRQATLYMCVSTTLIMVVISLITGGYSIPVSSLGWTHFLISLSFFAYAMIGYYFCISLIGAGDTTFFSNLEPIVAVGTGFVFLGQALAPLQYIGITIVVCALIYAGRKKE
ncbi:MAG: DMT family transporter [Rhodospirillales bacterium]